MTLTLDRRILALASAIVGAAVIGAAGALVTVLGGGTLELTHADLARILAGGLTGALAGYAQAKPSQ